MLEESQRELNPQNAPHRLINRCHRYAAGPDQRGQLRVVEVGHHIHVHTGVEGLLRGRRCIQSDAVMRQLHHRGVIADHKAVKAPLPAENSIQQVGVRRHGNAVKRVERTHYGGRASLHRGLVRRKVDLAEAALAHVRGVVLATGLRRAIGGKMLHGRRHAVRLGKSVALVTADVGARHRRSKIGVLARAFRRAAPARVAGDVHHRRVKPANARGRRLLGRHA